LARRAAARNDSLGGQNPLALERFAADNGRKKGEKEKRRGKRKMSTASKSAEE
jgi:hypothetical protein